MGAIVWTTFIPPTSILLLAAAFYIARFENQRWVRARARGLRGASEGFGVFVDLTGMMSILFALLFLIATGYDFGWRAALGLILITQIVGLAYSLISTAILRGDRIGVWMVGTLSIWALMPFLAIQVSWFGLVD